MTQSSIYLTLLSVLMLMACTDITTDKDVSPENITRYDLTVDYNTAPIDLSTPQATAYSMMIAMYRGDAEAIDNIFMENATLRRVKPDGSVSGNGLPRWRDWVGTLEVGQAHEEIFNLNVEHFGKLATVWAPFVITVNGEIAGCGVNQLSMAQQDSPEGPKWRIIFGIDTAAPKESCEGFKESYDVGSRINHVI